MGRGFAVVEISMDFSNRRFLVCGASSGIGEACARRLHAMGAGVTLVARRESCLQRITDDLGDRADYRVCDLSRPGGALELFEKLTFPFDGLVYSAGIKDDMPLSVREGDRAAQIYQVNYSSFVETLQQFTKRGRYAKNAAAVAISSISAFAPGLGCADYAASKAALNAAVSALALELLRKNVRVNAIAPGFTETDMLKNQVSNELRSQISQKQPLGIVEPDAVAALAAFLLSEQARYMTGLIVPMDAGSLLR